MARSRRRSSTHINEPASRNLIEELLNNSNEFSFFQAIRLLRHSIRGRSSGNHQEMSEMIRVKPDLSLSFPASDISRIEQAEQNGEDIYHITATFLGLYGTTSPLPTFYTEDLLLEHANDESVSKDFIDVLNQRLYDLLFQGWSKYRNYYQVAEQTASDHIERLYCLIGLGSDNLRHIPGELDISYRLLRYIGLFTQFPRSAAGLSTILSDALRGTPLRIEPCILRKAKIPEHQQFRVGKSGSRLGSDSYLGDEIEDRMGKFRIQIGPLDQAGFLEFTPGNKNYNLLTALTEIYCVEPLAYEIELILAARQAQTVSLGDPIRSVLGVTTWVFSRAHLGEVRTRFSVPRK